MKKFYMYYGKLCYGVYKKEWTYPVLTAREAISHLLKRKLTSKSASTKVEEMYNAGEIE